MSEEQKELFELALSALSGALGDLQELQMQGVQIPQLDNWVVKISDVQQEVEEVFYA